MLSLIFLGFVSIAQAGVAKVDFTAHTNMPGVSVEGKADGINVPFDRKSPQGAVVELDVFELKTGMDKRDQHLREKVFAAKKPGDAKIRFEVTEFDSVKGSVKGKLAIKGVTKEVTIPVKTSGDQIVGQTTINLADYSLPRPSFMGVKVEESVDVNFTFKE